MIPEKPDCNLVIIRLVQMIKSNAGIIILGSQTSLQCWAVPQQVWQCHVYAYFDSHPFWHPVPSINASKQADTFYLPYSKVTSCTPHRTPTHAHRPKAQNWWSVHNRIIIWGMENMTDKKYSSKETLPVFCRCGLFSGVLRSGTYFLTKDLQHINRL